MDMVSILFTTWLLDKDNEKQSKIESAFRILGRTIIFLGFFLLMASGVVTEASCGDVFYGCVFSILAIASGAAYICSLKK